MGDEQHKQHKQLQVPNVNDFDVSSSDSNFCIILTFNPILRHNSPVCLCVLCTGNKPSKCLSIKQERRKILEYRLRKAISEKPERSWNVIYLRIDEIGLFCGMSSQLLKTLSPRNSDFSAFFFLNRVSSCRKLVSPPCYLLFWQNRCHVTVKTFQISISAKSVKRACHSSVMSVHTGNTDWFAI